MTSLQPLPARSLRSWISIGLAVLAVFAFYIWIGHAGQGKWPTLLPAGEHEGDHFNLLSRGFLKGHLYVDLDVAQSILDAKNPYDPTQRVPGSYLPDASYYRGHYYLYFGPAPIVTLLAPFTLVTGRDLPLPLAVWIFSLAGYAALAAIFLFVQRRYFPAASTFALVVGLIGIGAGTMLIAVLRRAFIWELSLAAGFCFFAFSLLCLVRAVHSRRATAWAALGGLLLGLAIASRPTYITCCVLFVLPLWWRRRQPEAAPHYRWPALLAAGAICAAIGMGLAWYNYARFENPLEFGMNYQLSNSGELENQHISLRYVPFNIRMYLTSALSWTSDFPHVQLPPIPPKPAGQGGVEQMYGLFPNLPFVWFSFAGLGLVLWRALRGKPDPAKRPWFALALVAAAVGLTLIVPMLFFGACLRYFVDFAPSLALLSGFGLLAAETALRWPFSRALLLGLGATTVAASALISALSVVNFYANKPISPDFYPLARILDWPSYRLRLLRYPDFGAREIVFTLPADRTPRREPLMTVTQLGIETALVSIEYVDADSFRLVYRQFRDEAGALSSRAMPSAPGQKHVLRLAIGGPYAEFDGANHSLNADLDGHKLWQVPWVSDHAIPGDVTVGINPATQPATRFSGVVHQQRPISASRIAGDHGQGVRVRFTLTRDLVGRRFPLIVSGVATAGDILFLHVRADGAVAVGYDHWSYPVRYSPYIPLRFDEPQVLECWVPVNGLRGYQPDVVARLNGTTIWHEPVPFYPAPPRTLVYGTNIIGSTLAERSFPGAVLDFLYAAPP